MCCLIYEHNQYARPKCDACEANRRSGAVPPPEADDAEVPVAQLTEDEEGTP
jgi:hypothetical protein